MITLGTVNGLYSQFKLYTSVSPHRMVIARQIISLIYTIDSTQKEEFLDQDQYDN
jgi:hypothetical protein